jgi:TBC1 domain family member 20
VIIHVLRTFPELCYFQGYHDIVQVFLLVLGPDAAWTCVSRLSLLRIRDYMLPSMTATTMQLHLIPNIIYKADRQLWEHLRPTHNQPTFSLASAITLFAHNVQEYGDIARLFDFLLASNALMPIYLYAAMVIKRREALLEVPEDDSAMLHFMLSKLPQPLDLEFYIEETIKLYGQYPPESLPRGTWSRISKHSVLKTTREPLGDAASQNLTFGRQEFALHAREIRQLDTITNFTSWIRRTVRNYRRPARTFALALAVGLLAFWWSRNPPGFIVTSLHRWINPIWQQRK